MLKTPEEVKSTLQGISNSITRCYNYIKGGYYVPENIIAHYLPRSNASLMKDLVFRDKESRRHGRVIALHSVNEPYVKVMQYNVYESRVTSGIVPVSDMNAVFWNQWFQPLPMQAKHIY